MTAAQTTVATAESSPSSPAGAAVVAEGVALDSGISVPTGTGVATAADDAATDGTSRPLSGEVGSAAAAMRADSIATVREEPSPMAETIASASAVVPCLTMTSSLSVYCVHKGRRAQRFAGWHACGCLQEF